MALQWRALSASLLLGCILGADALGGPKMIKSSEVGQQLAPAAPVPGAVPGLFDIRTFGAKADGRFDCSVALALAFDSACKWAQMGRPATVLVPEVADVAGEGAFVSRRTLMLQGPCGPGSMTIRVDGFLKFDAVRARTITTRGLIDVRDVDNFTVHGSGTIYGFGPSWWAKQWKPHMLLFNHCKHVTVYGLRFIMSPRTHLVFYESQHVHVWDVATFAPPESPNTDSINIVNCHDVVVERSFLHAGDDCVAISGNSSDVILQQMMCTAGHGYSIGSLGVHGRTACVSNITVQNSVLRDVDNGVRIKTYQGGRGIVSNVVFRNITMHNAYNPINLDQYYCDIKPCPISPDAVAINNVLIDSITASVPDGVHSVKLNCSDSVPCTDVVMLNLDIHLAQGDARPMTPVVRNAFGSSFTPDTPSLGALPFAPVQFEENIRRQAALCGIQTLSF